MATFAAEGAQLRWELSGCRRHLTEAEGRLLLVLDEWRLHRAVDAAREQRLAEVSRELRVLKLAAEIGRDEVVLARRAAEPACWAWPADPARPELPSRNLEGLRAWHDGCCALCGRRGRVVVDHDHWSLLVRGLLCQPCNLDEGRTPPGNSRAGLYRQRPPAAMFDLRIPCRG